MFPNPVDWFKGLFDGLIDLLNKAYIDLFVGIATLLTQTIIPAITTFELEWFRTMLGGFIGLAQALMMVIIVVLGVQAAATPFSPHGRKVSRVVSGIARLIIFMVLFYPAIDIALSLSAAARDLVITLVTGQPASELTETVKKMSESAMPSNAFGKFVSIIILLLFGAIMAVEAVGIMIMTILVALFYPVPTVLKTVSDSFEKPYHFFNATILVAILGPPLMALFVLSPLIVAKFPFGENGFVMILATIVGCIAACCAPIAIGVAAYRKSSEVFGSIEGSIRGAIDVNSMPSVRSQVEQQRSIRESSDSAFKAFATTALAGGATAIAAGGTKDFFQKMKHVGADAAAAAATATGHPGLGAVIQGLDAASATRRERKAKEAEQGDNNPAGTPPPSQEQSPQQSQPASTVGPSVPPTESSSDDETKPVPSQSSQESPESDDYSNSSELSPAGDTNKPPTITHTRM